MSNTVISQTLRFGSNTNFPAYPQPEKGEKIICVMNDTRRLYFRCEIDLMAVRGRFIPASNNNFSFDAEMKLERYLEMTLLPDSGQVADRCGVYYKPDGHHTLWSRNGWEVGGSLNSRSFFAACLGTWIPVTPSTRWIKTEMLVGGAWVEAKRKQVGAAQYEFTV